MAELAARTRQVLFIARGSSDAAALYGRYLCEVGAGRLATPASPSVATRYRRRLDLDGVLAVALSQSGRTEEIVETLTWAADCGATTVAITNDGGQPAGGRRPAGPGHPGRPGAGGAGDQVLHHPARRAGRARARPRRRPGPARPAGPKCPTPSPWTLESDVDPLAAALSDVDGLVVSGRGFAASTAWELSLKVRETCAIDASGLSYADLLHGPIAVAGARTPALLVAADDGPRARRRARRWPSRLRGAGVPVHADRRRAGTGRGRRRRAARAGPARAARPAGAGRTRASSRWRRWPAGSGSTRTHPAGLKKVTQTDEEAGMTTSVHVDSPTEGRNPATERDRPAADGGGAPAAGRRGRHRAGRGRGRAAGAHRGGRPARRRAAGPAAACTSSAPAPPAGWPRWTPTSSARRTGWSRGGGPRTSPRTTASVDGEDDTVAGAAVGTLAGPGDVLVAVTASGRTPYAIAALRTAREQRRRHRAAVRKPRRRSRVRSGRPRRGPDRTGGGDRLDPAQGRYGTETGAQRVVHSHDGPLWTDMVQPDGRRRRDELETARPDRRGTGRGDRARTRTRARTRSRMPMATAEWRFSRSFVECRYRLHGVH